MGFWAVATYRAGAWARGIKFPGVRFLLLFLAWAVKQPFRMILHVELPFGARIGPGFAIFHPYNVLIGAHVEIGDECTLYHEVTLGGASGDRSPRLGAHVVLFPGARVLGGVTIGERSEIGANCVVSRSVPPYSIVVAALPRTLPQSLVPRSRPAPSEEPG
ncbi:MAG: serine acetyltransferase [Anaeromyxobacteraceae bacterium]